jgi:hypothetical protein
VKEALTSLLDVGEWSALHPNYFTPEEMVPDTHWIGGWVGLGANLDAVEKRKVFCPCWIGHYTELVKLNSSSPSISIIYFNIILQYMLF